MSHTIGQIKQNKQQSKKLSQVESDSLKPEELTRSPMLTLSDADYEFLFNQLLEGISHGWHDRRIVKFFTSLGDRANQTDWVAWLERLKVKASALPSQSKRQLGVMMIRLGELTRSTTEVDKIGAASHRIGKELLFGNVEDIWEYVGPDLSSDYEATDKLTKRDRQELSERLPIDFNAVSSDEVVEEIEESSELVESLETELRSSLMEDSSLFSVTESGSDLSPLKPNITEIELDRERPQDITMSIPTETELEAFDIARVMNLIQEDEELARQISQKLNSAIAKPQDIPLDSSSLELIESWFNLGLKQVSVGEFGKAIASWEKALKINPNLSEAWHNRGSALGRLGDYQAAIKSFQNALAIDPDNYQAWNDRAHALYQLQNWSLAADSWSNAIKIMPGNHLFWYNRGCALEQLQRWDEAIASHEKALSIVPNFQPARSRYINLIADSYRSN